MAAIKRRRKVIHWPREEIRRNWTEGAKVKPWNIFQDHYHSEGEVCGKGTL